MPTLLYERAKAPKKASVAVVLSLLYRFLLMIIGSLELSSLAPNQLREQNQRMA